MLAISKSIVRSIARFFGDKFEPQGNWVWGGNIGTSMTGEGKKSFSLHYSRERQGGDRWDTAKLLVMSEAHASAFLPGLPEYIPHPTDDNSEWDTAKLVGMSDDCARAFLPGLPNSAFTH